MAVQKSHRSKGRVTFRKKLTVIKINLTKDLKKNFLKKNNFLNLNKLI
jgi:hypothetical protein